MFERCSVERIVEVVLLVLMLASLLLGCPRL